MIKQVKLQTIQLVGYILLSANVNQFWMALKKTYFLQRRFQGAVGVNADKVFFFTPSLGLQVISDKSSSSFKHGSFEVWFPNYRERQKEVTGHRNCNVLYIIYTLVNFKPYTNYILLPLINPVLASKKIFVLMFQLRNPKGSTAGRERAGSTTPAAPTSRRSS